MSTFEGGPAEGKRLMLRRAARFIRVVIDRRTKETDALDQPGDAPSVTEDLFAYEILRRPGHCHIRSGRGAKIPSGFYPIGHYRFVEPQPAESIMRTSQAWQAWCESQPDRPELHQTFSE